MEFSAFITGRDWPYPDFRAVVQEAERLGFSAAWQDDNFTGHSPYPRDMPGFDVWAMLPALAEATSKIRLGPMATPVLRRFPPVFAKTAASFDVISGGRLNLALGAGDDATQFESLGQPFPERAERLAILKESIDVIKLMWIQHRANYQGEHFHLKDAIMTPKPLQKPHPPIWLAVTSSKRVMPRLAAEYADAVCINWGHDGTVEEAINAYRERCVEMGTQPESRTMCRRMSIVLSEEGYDWEPDFTRITSIPLNWDLYASTAKVPPGTNPFSLVVGPPDKVAEEIRRRSVDLGFNHLMFNFLSVGSFEKSLETNGIQGWAGNYLGSMRLAAKEVLPRIRSQNAYH